MCLMWPQHRVGLSKCSLSTTHYAHVSLSGVFRFFHPFTRFNFHLARANRPTSLAIRPANAEQPPQFWTVSFHFIFSLLLFQMFAIEQSDYTCFNFQTTTQFDSYRGSILQNYVSDSFRITHYTFISIYDNKIKSNHQQKHNKFLSKERKIERTIKSALRLTMYGFCWFVRQNHISV